MVLNFRIFKDMSCISDYDKNDFFNNHWTSSDSERSLSKMSSECSLDNINDKRDSSSDIELNITANAEYDGKKLSMSESDLELNFTTSNIHPANSSLTNTVVDEIPSLVDDDFMDDSEISDNEKSENEPSDEVDDEFIMKQLEKLIIRRNKKDNEARLRLFLQKNYIYYEAFLNNCNTFSF